MIIGLSCFDRSTMASLFENYKVIEYRPPLI